jgi:hypothetical protein
MLPLDDPRWKSYEGGYRLPYDASVPLGRLLRDGGSEALWAELWEELYHQGDVGAASYAAVPYLVEFVRRSAAIDWNALALIALIELQRPSNPPVPPEITESYFEAIGSVPAVVGMHPQRTWDDLVTASAMAGIALARGQRLLARAYFELGLDDAREWLIRERGYHRSDLVPQFHTRREDACSDS